MFPWTLAISWPEEFSIHHWEPISWRIFFLMTACNWFWVSYISNVGLMARTFPWISPRRNPRESSRHQTHVRDIRHPEPIASCHQEENPPTDRFPVVDGKLLRPRDRQSPRKHSRT